MCKVTEWVQKLIPYMDGLRISDIEFNRMEDDPAFYILTERGSGQLVGDLVLNENAELRYFHYRYEEGRTPVVSLSPIAVRERAGRFVNQIFGEDADDLKFSSVVDLDTVYSVDFVRIDEDGLELPNSGISFSFYKDGGLIDVMSHLGPVVLIDEQYTITPEAALDLYMANLSAELKISRYDSYLYVDGDDQFKLIYDFLTGSPDEVKMDGTVVSLTEELGLMPPGHEMLDSRKPGTERGNQNGFVTYNDALETAIRLLFEEHPNASRLFQLRKEANDRQSSDSEPLVYSFAFDRFEGGIPVEDEGVEIDIDAATGQLARVEATGSAEADFSGLLLEPPLNPETAKALFASNITMRPVRTRNEDPKSRIPIYELAYVPVFPDPGGHVHAIDAHTLEKWTVDTGSLLEG